MFPGIKRKQWPNTRPSTRSSGHWWTPTLNRLSTKPVANARRGQKKELTGPLLLAQSEEIQALIDRFTAAPATGETVQNLEGLIRTAIFKPATALVGFLLQAAAQRIEAAYRPLPGESRKGLVELQVQCLFGTFPLQRQYYYHPGKKCGHYPADEGLGLEVGYTPALARLMSLEGAKGIYEEAQLHLREAGGIEVEARQIHRVVDRIGPMAHRWQQEREFPPHEEPAPIMYVSADGTGIPMRTSELIGRKGKQPDGSAKTRQVYLGCVFTQHGRDEKGHPVRDYHSTSYLSHLGPIDEFAPMLRREALRRGMGNATHVVFLVDGAEGLECMGRDYFLGCTQIVDFYHAMEHASHVLVAWLGSKEHPDFKARLHRWAKRLLKNGVNKLVTDARLESSGSSKAAAVEDALGYFIRNAPRMQYCTFRKAGFFIGSGVVEAGCKTVIGSRCKQSGMHWGVPGAQHVLALRCINASGRLADFWKHRLNSRAAHLPRAA